MSESGAWSGGGVSSVIGTRKNELVLASSPKTHRIACAARLCSVFKMVPMLAQVGSRLVRRDAAGGRPTPHGCKECSAPQLLAITGGTADMVAALRVSGTLSAERPFASSRRRPGSACRCTRRCSRSSCAMRPTAPPASEFTLRAMREVRGRVRRGRQARRPRPTRRYTAACWKLWRSPPARANPVTRHRSTSEPDRVRYIQ